MRRYHVGSASVRVQPFGGLGLMLPNQKLARLFADRQRNRCQPPGRGVTGTALEEVSRLRDRFLDHITHNASLYPKVRSIYQRVN